MLAAVRDRREEALREAERRRKARQERAEYESLSDLDYYTQESGVDDPERVATYLTQLGYGDREVGELLSEAEKARAEAMQAIEESLISPEAKEAFRTQGPETFMDAESAGQILFGGEDASPDKVAMRRNLYDRLELASRAMDVLGFQRRSPRPAYVPSPYAQAPQGLGGGAQAPTMGSVPQGGPGADDFRGSYTPSGASPEGQAPSMAQQNAVGQVIQQARAAQQMAEQQTQGPEETPLDRMMAGETALWYSILNNPQAPLGWQAAAWVKLASMLPIQIPVEIEQWMTGMGLSEEQVLENAQQALMGTNHGPWAENLPAAPRAQPVFEPPPPPQRPEPRLGRRGGPIPTQVRRFGPPAAKPGQPPR